MSTSVGGERGWVIANPLMFLDAAKAKSLGWKAKVTIREGMTRTLDYLGAHSWGLEERA